MLPAIAHDQADNPAPCAKVKYDITLLRVDKMSQDNGIYGEAIALLMLQTDKFPIKQGITGNFRIPVIYRRHNRLPPSLNWPIKLSLVASQRGTAPFLFFKTTTPSLYHSTSKIPKKSHECGFQNDLYFWPVATIYLIPVWTQYIPAEKVYQRKVNCFGSTSKRDLFESHLFCERL
jgi:hypothetical protein